MIPHSTEVNVIVFEGSMRQCMASEVTFKYISTNIPRLGEAIISKEDDKPYKVEAVFHVAGTPGKILIYAKEWR